MVTRLTPFKCVVAAFSISTGLAGPVSAQSEVLDRLFNELLAADETSHATVAAQIRGEWSKSGSAAMDLLLRRGTEALENGEPGVAVEHFTALIDHAPDFAEGYHGRAGAFFALGLIGPAIDDLREALVLAPRHYEAMYGLGNVMEALERPADALEVYQLILEIYPHNPPALDAVERLKEQLQGQAL